MRREDKIKLEANTAKVYGRNEINKVVSKAVLMYLKGGFVLIPTCSKENVDLAKGDEYVRIKTTQSYNDNYPIHIDVLVGKNKGNRELWDKDLAKHANICTFYTVGHPYTGGVTRSKAKAEECNKKSDERYCSRVNFKCREVANLTSDKAKEVAVSIIHKYPRTKSITTKNVLGITKDNSGKWIIEYVTNNGNKKVITSHLRYEANKGKIITFS
jgi:hypothetical protein